MSTIAEPTAPPAAPVDRRGPVAHHRPMGDGAGSTEVPVLAAAVTRSASRWRARPTTALLALLLGAGVVGLTISADRWVVHATTGEGLMRPAGAEACTERAGVSDERWASTADAPASSDT